MADHFPWEPQPTLQEAIQELRRDFAYAVTNTAVLVRSSNPAMRMVVNTERGQAIPKGECRFTDGTTVEFQDIAMPQPGVPHMTVRELAEKMLALAADLGLELVP